MDKYTVISLIAVIIFVSGCSQSIPYDYTKEELKQVEEESFNYFPTHLQDQYDKSDVNVQNICEIDNRTLTENNYHHVFIVQLEDENLNVGLNHNTKNVDLIGNFSNTEQCKEIR